MRPPGHAALTLAGMIGTTPATAGVIAVTYDFEAFIDELVCPFAGSFTLIFDPNSDYYVHSAGLFFSSTLPLRYPAAFTYSKGLLLLFGFDPVVGSGLRVGVPGDFVIEVCEFPSSPSIGFAVYSSGESLASGFGGTLTQSAVPDPASLALLGAGLGEAVVVRRGRRVRERGH